MNRKNEIERYAPYFLLAAVLLGLALRLYKLDFQSLWIDELYTIVPTNPSNTISSVVEYAKGDQPPLLFLLVHFWFKLFGYTEYSARLIAVAFGILGIISIYFLGKELDGKLTGVFAAFLLAVNHFHILYSQDVRFYGLLFLMTTVSFLFFLKSLQNQNTKNVSIYVFSTIGLLYTHYYSFFVLAAQSAIFTYKVIKDKDHRLFGIGVTSFTLICLGYLPWFDVILGDLADVLPHIKPVTAFFPFQYLYYYFGKDAFTLLLLVVLLIFFLRKEYFRNQWKKSILFLAFWILITYTIPYVRSLMISPMIVDRYTIITLPAWLILFSLSWSALRPNRARLALLLIVLLSSILNLFLFRRYYTKITREQWREASSYVLDTNHDKCPVLSPSSWHFSFYFKETTYQVQPLNDQSLQNVRRFWLLLAHLSPDEVNAQIQLIGTNFVLLDRKDFYGASAILFESKSR